MDSVTHIFLGGAIAQAIAARHIGYRRAFLAGALAATFPDFDVFLHTGDTMRDLALHRHFMHALVIVPVLALLSILPFLIAKQIRPHWKPLYLAALAACASHTFLDTLTSYGTMIFWPFYAHRFALDIIPVIDPLYTLPLIIGAVLAAKMRALKPAAIALAFSCVYLGFVVWQHSRAQAAQAELLAARHVAAPENPRVLPQVGAVISYRSIYIDGGQIHADAIRIPLFAPPSFKPGGVLTRLTSADIHSTLPSAGRDFASFNDLADGFLARSPADPLYISDQRYTFLPQGLESVWGIQLEETDRAVFRITPRWNYFGGLARDLFRPRGYASAPTAFAPAPP